MNRVRKEPRDVRIPLFERHILVALVAADLQDRLDILPQGAANELEHPWGRSLQQDTTRSGPVSQPPGSADLNRQCLEALDSSLKPSHHSGCASCYVGGQRSDPLEFPR